MSDTTPADSRARLHRVGSPRARRILIVANQTATSPRLIAELRELTGDAPVSLHLVIPALNTRLRHWLSDTDEAVLAAHHRAEQARSELRAHGLPVSVEVGDTVPLLAIEDALVDFDADEIVISTLHPDRSHWLEHELVESARRRFEVPVRHVIATVQATAAA